MYCTWCINTHAYIRICMPTVYMTLVCTKVVIKVTKLYLFLVYNFYCRLYLNCTFGCSNLQCQLYIYLTLFMCFYEQLDV